MGIVVLEIFMNAETILVGFSVGLAPFIHESSGKME